MDASIETIWKQFMQTSDSQILEATESLQNLENENKKTHIQSSTAISNILNPLKEEQERLLTPDKEQEEEMQRTVQTIQTEIEAEIRQEMEDHERTASKLKDLVGHLESDLLAKFRAEKKEGQRTHGNLVRLLEDACSRIERSFSGRSQINY